MFGFPESPSDWTKKDYLRLFTIIMAYIVLRPILQKLYERIGERRRKEEQKKTQEEQIRKHQQERVRDKLGISSLKEEEFKKNMSASNNSAAAARSSARKAERAARERLQKLEAENQLPTEDSDEDVSDLLA